MAVYTVFTKNEKTSYKSTLCSKSSIFLVFITFLTLFFPLLIAYRSQGFWVKFLSYREQPIVNFKRDYFLYVETNEESEPIICTTIQKQSEDLEELDHCTSVRISEQDNNGDGKLDALFMEIEINTQENISIHSIYLVLVFDFILQNQCIFQMESLAVLQANCPFQSKELQVIGDLVLEQRTLLNCRGRDLRYNQSSFSDPYLNIQQLVKQHSLQNVSTRFSMKNQHWTRGVDTTFTMNVHLLYPEVTVQYKPGFWPVMKWAWIQYLPILVIFVYLGRWIKGYVFLNHLLPTMPERPWKKLITQK